MGTHCFFLTDGRVVGHSIATHPYTEDCWLERPKYVPDDGVYLRLYGRSASGKAVVAEVAVPHLTLALVLPEDSAARAHQAVDELQARAAEHLSAAEARARGFLADVGSMHVVLSTSNSRSGERNRMIRAASRPRAAPNAW